MLDAALIVEVDLAPFCQFKGNRNAIDQQGFNLCALEAVEGDAVVKGNAELIHWVSFAPVPNVCNGSEADISTDQQERPRNRFRGLVPISGSRVRRSRPRR